MVRGLPFALGCQSYGCHHGFWLLCCFGHRPAGGRDLLRHPAPTELSVAERGIGGLGTLRSLLKGFEGEENHRRWLECYGVRVIYPPKRNSRKRNWPKRLRRRGSWNTPDRRDGLRQALQCLRPLAGAAHELEGLRARFAARVALHNFCIWLNEQLGRPRLAFADLLEW